MPPARAQLPITALPPDQHHRAAECTAGVSRPVANSPTRRRLASSNVGSPWIAAIAQHRTIRKLSVRSLPEPRAYAPESGRTG